MFERTKHKYLDHIRNVQNDLHETRQLIERDADLKMNQESAYQQLIDERRQLLTRYNPSRSDTDTSAYTPSSTIDDTRTHPRLNNNVAFYRQVLCALLICIFVRYDSHLTFVPITLLALCFELQSLKISFHP